MNVRRDYRIWISQKMQKKKVLKELVFLYIYLISVLGEINKNQLIFLYFVLSNFLCLKLICFFKFYISNILVKYFGSVF